jgi:hypothetical protein
MIRAAMQLGAKVTPFKIDNQESNHETAWWFGGGMLGQIQKLQQDMAKAQKRWPRNLGIRRGRGNHHRGDGQSAHQVEQVAA